MVIVGVLLGVILGLCYGRLLLWCSYVWALCLLYSSKETEERKGSERAFYHSRPCPDEKVCKETNPENSKLLGVSVPSGTAFKSLH